MIGYDRPQTPSRRPSDSSMIGVPVPHTWKVDGDEITIRTELGGGATYTGSGTKNGKSIEGGRRPDKGACRSLQRRVRHLERGLLGRLSRTPLGREDGSPDDHAVVNISFRPSRVPANAAQTPPGGPPSGDAPSPGQP